MRRILPPWTPDSWRRHATGHQPEFRDRAQLASTLARLAALPPLVAADAVEELKAQLALAQAGKAFVLQAGDCAEAFAECTDVRLTSQARLLYDMGTTLSRHLGRPTITIGRIAGQYAKPRSSPTEVVGGRELPAFFGDNVNGHGWDQREPEAARLLQAYIHSSATLNHLRHLRRETGHTIFTSHEALLLDCEQQQTRYHDRYGAWFNLSAHMLWIGERTRALSGGHVEYARGIANPIGVKVGPDADVRDIVAITARLNPHNVAGKVALISRFGHTQMDRLRRFATAFHAAGAKALWLSDPMHGNTRVTAAGIKTRSVDDIAAEIRQTRRILADLGQTLHGLHLEVAGEDVTECLGGSPRLAEADLRRNYRSLCDPRLNRRQALDIANLFARTDVLLRPVDNPMTQCL